MYDMTLCVANLDFSGFNLIMLGLFSLLCSVTKLKFKLLNQILKLTLGLKAYQCFLYSSALIN